MKGMVHIQAGAEKCLNDFAANCSYLLDLHDRRRLIQRSAFPQPIHAKSSYSVARSHQYSLFAGQVVPGTEELRLSARSLPNRPSRGFLLYFPAERTRLFSRAISALCSSWN